ncbi:DUF4240 domain-containing protein [Amycolatopsis acidicola]|uniref:DUF4240 domain-containing protein n=1 Tax=Amycolatopsis acidicola TaxID=2596893 RepID=A0A5N0UZG0_9PSEU|nr:DUF4240 domain-containing protein [Amycolatopsis acidicola]KAA9157204.1 DUF4240 domain-containing protein [Amycolatopsis acidicola]
MGERFLWRLIATAREQSGPDTLAGVRRLLEEEAAPEVIRFHRELVGVHRRARGWDLLAAFGTLPGAGGIAGFADAISWLVLRGRRDFRRVLADPDELASWAVEPGEIAAAAGLLRAAPERLLPPHDPEEDRRVFEEAIRQALGVAEPAGPPPGEPLQTDRESLRRRYPRLVARYGLAAPDLMPGQR